MLTRRLKPSFFIIGGVKCGTTSLFRYLIEHPQVLPGKLKEPAFFNNRGLLKALLRYPKYLKNFPKKNAKEATILNWPILTNQGKIIETLFEKQRSNTTHITGDASATYNSAADPKVIKKLFPQAKIIFLLRDPSDRFISHWRMFQRFNEEGRAGYDVGDLIPFIKKEIDAHNSDSTRDRIIHQGLYHQIIQEWRKWFSEDNFMVVHTRDLQAPDLAGAVLEEITSFLGLYAFDYSSILGEKFNVAPKMSLNHEAKELLDEFYKEPNELLLKKLGIDFT